MLLLKLVLRNETVKANCKAKAAIITITNIFLNFDFQSYKKVSKNICPKMDWEKDSFFQILLYSGNWFKFFLLSQITTCLCI